MEDAKLDNKIKVLGRTFNSEEERRNYFREELRKMLPDLKQTEGFPIGKDEDILSLSDPPYYTACPNPWLNDFVTEWEKEKELLTAKGVRENFLDDVFPYASDVKVGKSHPIYTAHTYHTKVPHQAIVRYLLHYTQPGDIVLDGFAGTGMTGVAGKICGNPDPKFKFELDSEWNKKFNVTPVWGKRNVICGDLSPYASLISYNYNSPSRLKEFISESKSLKEKVLEKCAWMYSTKHPDGGTGYINYMVFSDVILCNNCSQEFDFWDIGMDFENKKVKDEFICSKCSSVNETKKLIRSFESKYDSFTGLIRRVKATNPKYIVYTYQGKRYSKEPDNEDLLILEKVNSEAKRSSVPVFKMMGTGSSWGDTWRSGVHAGVEYVHDFFSTRNYLALEILDQCINKSELPLKLKFILTAMIKRSTNMNRIHIKNFFYGGGGWNAGGLAGTLYIPSMQVETSIISQIDDKIKALNRALPFLSEEYNLQYTGSCTTLNLKNCSVDYIFTDPPFGDNIMYSELNYLSEAWIKLFTNNSKEAISSKSQNKSTYDYQNLMFKSFSEYYRVLKPGKWMTVEFSNTSAAVWNAIQTSLQQSGFIVANVSSLDKKQGGMRSITSATAVKQDLIISCYKPSSEFDQKFKQHQNTDVAVWDFVEEHLNHIPIHLVKDNATTAIIERSPKILFDRLIAFYVQKGLPVPIDAGAFQKGLRERFIERDGMFFTNYQVQEYDKKKAENPEFIQLSILVSSEQDGVLWLKNVLSEKSLAYQDIQPLWMQALVGVRKGDVIPELADMLEENFLKDEQSKWYVPNPENEADLEKLRTKRLLKQFELYITEAAKPKGKIKEVRVEALRAGFKQLYQDKDFKTIVQIGDRIPNNLLMEDEVLLQFYDIASSRV